MYLAIRNFLGVCTCKQHCTKLMNRSIFFLRLFFTFYPLGTFEGRKWSGWSSHFMACCKWSVWVLARQKKETRLNYSVLGSISADSRPRRLCVSSANPIDNDVVPRAGGRASTTTDSHENCWSPQREILVSNRCDNVNRRQIWKAKFELKKNLLILFRATFASHNF